LRKQNSGNDCVSQIKSDRSDSDDNVFGVYNNNFITKGLSSERNEKKTSYGGFNFNKSTAVTGTLHYYYLSGCFTAVGLTADRAVYCCQTNQLGCIQRERFTLIPIIHLNDIACSVPINKIIYDSGQGRRELERPESSEVCFFLLR